MRRIPLPQYLVVILLTTLISACAGSGVTAPTDATTRARADACKSGDIPIASNNECLMDDAACYPLTNGSWCTGERGNSCPTGSMPLPSGSPCPAGARCFALSESLNCYIGG